MPHSYLAIVGPTAVGKSDFALAAAQKMLDAGAVGVDIISVDSKQVYRGLEILSGADVPPSYRALSPTSLPANYQLLPPFFASADHRIFLHGISIIEPHEDWSVAHFQTFAQSVLLAAERAQRAVLFVGGTGLYYAHLFSTDAQLRIGPNQALRQRLESLSLSQLQAEANQAAPEAFAAMNNSDRSNPRRLVRLLEKRAAQPRIESVKAPHAALRYVGLRADVVTLQARIDARVAKRLDGGALQEVERLLAHRPAPTAAALATLGVADIADYLAGSVSREQCAAQWALHEFQYAKRQLTWWRKQPVEWQE